MPIGGTAMQASVGRPEIQLADVLPTVLHLLPEGIRHDAQMLGRETQPF